MPSGLRRSSPPRPGTRVFEVRAGVGIGLGLGFIGFRVCRVLGLGFWGFRVYSVLGLGNSNTVLEIADICQICQMCPYKL